MATVKTYLLVSDADDLEAVQSHTILENWDLAVQDAREGDQDHASGVTFVHETTLEDQVDLSKPAQTLSSSFPEAVVLLCEVEERFDHIERLQSKMYRKGKKAGNVEHGYVFNIGGA